MISQKILAQCSENNKRNLMKKIDEKLNTVVPVGTVFGIFSVTGFWLKISKLGCC